MFRGFSRNVYILGFLSLFNDLTADMITPLLPAFLASMGLGAEFLGLMEGIANSLSNLTILFSGWYADKLGKNKTLTVFGYGLASFVRPFLAISIPAVTLIVRFLDRIGKGIRTAPRDTLLTASLDEKKWGRAFGIQRAMDHTGALLGPPIAVWLLSYYSISLPKLFVFASIPAILSVIFLPPKITDHHREEKAQIPKLSWKKLPKTLKIYVCVIFFAALSTPSELFMILKMQSLGLAVAYAPLAWFILTLFTLLAALGGGVLADYWSRRRTIGLGWLIFILVYLGFAFNSQIKFAWLLLAVYGIQSGLVEASERTFAAKISQEHSRATTMGWYYFAYGLGLLPASLIFGYFWKNIGSSFAFSFFAAISLIPIVLLFFLPSDRILSPSPLPDYLDE